MPEQVEQKLASGTQSPPADRNEDKDPMDKKQTGVSADAAKAADASAEKAENTAGKY